jgi:hypothetical protein
MYTRRLPLVGLAFAIFAGTALVSPQGLAQTQSVDPRMIGTWEKHHPNGVLAEYLMIDADGTAHLFEFHDDRSPQSFKIAAVSARDGVFKLTYSYIALREKASGAWGVVSKERLAGKELFIGPTTVPYRFDGAVLNVMEGGAILRRRAAP